MTEYTATLQSSNQTFTVKPNELLLDAALRQGVKVPYSCRNGTCRTCIVEVIQGCVEPVDADLCMISKQELESNRRLLCMSLCKSDAIMEKVQPRSRRKET